MQLKVLSAKMERNQPEYIELQKICEDTLESLENALNVYPDAPLFKIEQDAWKKRLDTVI